jgi:CheY-like chemotaxis protein
VAPTRSGPILIAEDDAATLAGLTELLSDAGYDVLSARDGQEAMDVLLSGTTPILSILDIGMPHLAGSELLRYLQTDPVLRFVPVLVVTGAPERLGRAVADAIITKPLHLPSLLEHVRRLTAPRTAGVEAEVARNN